ncbi:hypothetical protein EDD15DRAFT_2204203 [Pisolithus albus]|nr:hypothetical protein EDD15DRAFT_2204203 [Pisolithus albus]
MIDRTKTMCGLAPNVCGGRLELNFDFTTPELPSRVEAGGGGTRTEACCPIVEAREAAGRGGGGGNLNAGLLVIEFEVMLTVGTAGGKGGKLDIDVLTLSEFEAMPHHRRVGSALQIIEALVEAGGTGNPNTNLSLIDGFDLCSRPLKRWWEWEEGGTRTQTYHSVSSKPCLVVNGFDLRCRPLKRRGKRDGGGTQTQTYHSTVEAPGEAGRKGDPDTNLSLIDGFDLRSRPLKRRWEQEEGGTRTQTYHSDFSWVKLARLTFHSLVVNGFDLRSRPLKRRWEREEGGTQTQTYCSRHESFDSSSGRWARHGSIDIQSLTHGYMGKDDVDGAGCKDKSAWSSSSTTARSTVLTVASSEEDDKR